MPEAGKTYLFRVPSVLGLGFIMVFIYSSLKR